MGLTGRQKEIIKETWALVAKGDLEETGMKIFHRLFSENPHMKKLFKFMDDTTMDNLRESSLLRRHALGVVRAVGTAVDLLEEPEKLLGTLSGLGKRHVKRGVLKEHFAPVGEALLYTLAAGLGEAIWTTEVKTAWIALYGAVESSMIAGMDSLKGKHVPGVTLLDTEIGY